MKKLTPTFIAGSLATNAGLAVALSQMNKDNPMQGDDMQGMGKSDIEMETWLASLGKEQSEGRLLRAVLG